MTSEDARQRPGLGYACDECRRRKQRCDGKRPQCSLCQGAGVVCEVTQRGVRGPKKGYMKALKDRVAQLEALLENRPGAQQHEKQHNQQDVSVSDVSGDDSTTPVLSTPAPSIAVFPTPPVGVEDSTTFAPFQDALSAVNSSASQIEIPSSTSSFAADLGPLHNEESPHLSFSDTQLHITAVVQAELDQLYFDRVHPSIPILHQRRYLSWSRSNTKRPSHICLQHAMWTLAALLSTQHRAMVDPLYSSTKQILESQGAEGSEPSGRDTEVLLAWVLVAICESMQTLHRQAWLNVGRAIRMVQGLRFHEIDSPRNPRNNPRSQPANVASEADDLTEIEQNRRVFWMVYFLDHLFSIRNDWPVTLNEHVVCTRLPISDPDFQTGQHALGDFLSEAMTEPQPKARAPFNECLIMVTICGRILLRGQQNIISEAYGDLGSDSAEQRWWLDGILTTRLQALSQCYPPPEETYDPLLLFAHLLAPATVVYFCKSIIDQLVNSRNERKPDEQFLEYQHRALDATTAIIRLVKILSDLHFSKVHPLTPLPLFLCAEFLYADRSTSESFSLQLQELVGALRQLKNANNLEQSYLDLLPQSCVNTLPELMA